METKKATIVRLILMAIGLFVAITGLAFGISNGQINLIPFSGLTYLNPLSGIVIGALGVLLSLAEVRILYRQRYWAKVNLAPKTPER